MFPRLEPNIPSQFISSIMRAVIALSAFKVIIKFWSSGGVKFAPFIGYFTSEPFELLITTKLLRIIIDPICPYIKWIFCPYCSNS